jgi:endonuclease/exonuclease/phosphatase family metal-dependent hydrolase
MPRIASAIGPVLALVAVAAPATPAHSLVPREMRPQVVAYHSTTTGAAHEVRRASRGIGLDGASLGSTFVNVSWNWIKAASGWRVQVARTPDFSAVVTTQKKRNSAHRPAGGREAAVVGHLKDATYYWVRVRKVKGSSKGPWSAPVQVATKAHLPDRFSGAKGTVGAEPGETTLTWKTDGGHTDLFRITTALTPFGSKSTPAVGRHSMTFRVPGDRRSLTLTPEQTAEAGAGLGTGRHLFFRISAVRKGEADTAVRRFPFLLHTDIAGQASTGQGTKLRFAAYNMHVQAKDVPGHLWKDRQHLIAQNIAAAHPAVVGLEELMPGMWTSNDGGVGLHASLRQAGVGQYELTRETPYWTGAGQDTRILYDPDQVQMVSSCDPSVPSCYIMLPDNGHQHVAAYALFRDLASGQEFYFVSAHLTAGNDADTDALRGEQAQAMNDGIRAVDTQNLPVVFATDANSSQTSKGSDSPHTVLLNDGWYNTIAAARVVNGQYNSVQHYHADKPSPYGFGSMYDTIMTLNMPGADLWKQVLTGSPFPSDHNMIFTDVRLP